VATNVNITATTPVEVLSSGRSVGSVAEKALGVVLIATAAPVIAFSAAAIVICSRRSPFVAHLRVGENGRPLWMWKLRTMWSRATVSHSERCWVERIIAESEEDRKNPSDARVCSRFAAFCRRHSIDELPQLIHVIRGEMALIGPRPMTRGEITRHYGALAGELLSVKPGLTGLWQVGGRSELDWQERVALDLQLVRDRSVKTLATIAAKTLIAVLDGKGAW
jgi:exopolysaccharide production protein ExoY